MHKILVTIISFFFLVSCSSSQGAFTLKKKSAIDEFLVEKKNPLVLPPEYGKLPVPEDSNMGENDLNENDIENIISKKNNKNSSVEENNSGENSLEKLILEKIR